jgi:predicted DNA-binding transcriptional regulator AlpA
MQETYLNPREAAEYIRSSPSTLANLRLTGGGPQYVRLGRAIRYRQRDLDTWLDASTSKKVRYRRRARAGSSLLADVVVVLDQDGSEK